MAKKQHFKIFVDKPILDVILLTSCYFNNTSDSEVKPAT